MANRDLTPWRSRSPMGLGGDPFTSFRREMDRLFDDFFTPAEPRSFGAPERARSAAVWPSLDVHETEQAYMVTAELPGIDQKDIELDLRDNVLTIRGEKRAEHSESEGGRSYSERSFGRFERIIPFPADVDPDRIEARYDNGVLRMTLPKSAQGRDKSRRIELQGNGAAAGRQSDQSSQAGRASQTGQASQTGKSTGAGQSGYVGPSDPGKAVG